MMMMIGELNASHTGVSGGPGRRRAHACRRAIPGFDLVADASGFYKVGHIYKDGPADHDYLKIKEGNFVVAVDDHDLKTATTTGSSSRSRPARSSTSWSTTSRRRTARGR